MQRNTDTGKELEQVKTGDECWYRAMIGDFYKAKITSIRSDGTVDISILVTPVPLRLTRRRIFIGEKSECPATHVTPMA